MSQQSKTVSYSLMFFLSSLVGLFIFFIFLVYFKINPPLSVQEKDMKDSIVDSITIIKQKDSLINVLSKDNERLKKMFDEKHDTVFVPKIIYRTKVDTTNKPGF